jgi:hypothetical protein
MGEGVGDTVDLSPIANVVVAAAVVETLVAAVVTAESVEPVTVLVETVLPVPDIIPSGKFSPHTSKPAPPSQQLKKSHDEQIISTSSADTNEAKRPPSQSPHAPDRIEGAHSDNVPPLHASTSALILSLDTDESPAACDS